MTDSTSFRETNSKRHPILVTGTPRSGTTWVGKIIATSPSVGYIKEPFNRKCTSRCSPPDRSTTTFLPDAEHAKSSAAQDRDPVRSSDRESLNLQSGELRLTF
jgi:hypothetical protein